MSNQSVETNLSSNLSPVKITIQEESLIVTCMIRAGASPQEIQWKKFSIRCETPKELWSAIHGIHSKGAQAIAEQSMGANFGCAESNNIHVSFDYVEEAIGRFKQKGGKITHVDPGASAFKTSKIDLDELMKGLDAIPSIPAEDVIDRDKSVDPVLPIGEALIDSEAA